MCFPTPHYCPKETLVYLPNILEVFPSVPLGAHVIPLSVVAGTDSPTSIPMLPFTAKIKIKNQISFSPQDPSIYLHPS
jgi:hypothetical protein